MYEYGKNDGTYLLCIFVRIAIHVVGPMESLASWGQGRTRPFKREYTSVLCYLLYVYTGKCSRMMENDLFVFVLTLEARPGTYGKPTKQSGMHYKASWNTLQSNLRYITKQAEIHDKAKQAEIHDKAKESSTKQAEIPYEAI